MAAFVHHTCTYCNHKKYITYLNTHTHTHTHTHTPFLLKKKKGYSHLNFEVVFHWVWSLKQFYLYEYVQKPGYKSVCKTRVVFGRTSFTCEEEFIKMLCIYTKVVFHDSCVLGFSKIIFLMFWISAVKQVKHSSLPPLFQTSPIYFVTAEWDQQQQQQQQN